MAASERGVVLLAFDGSEAQLARAYPDARLHGPDAEMEGWLDTLIGLIDKGGDHAIPLDPMGTAFQQQVWAELRKIPSGETRSYADIAADLGQPGATRAVGTANGANPIAVLIPCHRVIRSDGQLGGYAGGLERKIALLLAEGALPTLL